MLVDEVHHLGDSRGSTLETVIVRMRMLCDAYVKKVDALRKEREKDNSSRPEAIVPEVEKVETKR